MTRGRPSRGDVYLGDDDTPAPMRRYLAPAVAVAVLGAFSVIVWYSYNQGVKQGANAVAPHIRAESVSTKRKPVQPGGQVAPHEGIYVYNPVGPNVDPPAVERLLPPPETPLPRPIPVIKADPKPPRAAAPPQVAVAPPVLTMEPKVREPLPDDFVLVQKPTPVSPQPLKADIQRILEDLQVPKITPAAGPVAEREAVPAPQVAAIAPDTERVWRVQVASMSSRAAAERAWSSIRREHANTLGSLEAKFRVTEIAGRGTFYRVQAGPLQDATTARAVCEALNARAQGCLVVPPER